ncbi:MAG: anhydro-N-acetylmuramic acid kinase [Spongiibacteraceae bacterium]
MPQKLYIGLMSGTSLDAIDAALLQFDDDRPRIRHQISHPIPPELRRRLLALCEGCDHELDRFGLADRHMGILLADAVASLLDSSGVAAENVLAIGSHGQTVRHRPGDDNRPTEDAFSLQLGDPHTIAEMTGILTVADFRRRDIAAGGQGAPLVPAFHAAAFGLPDHDRIVANIGGMANISVLPRSGETSGFDTGPGNVLMDSWIQHWQRKPYDSDGKWAASGQVNAELLEKLLDDPYYRTKGPKSTGREKYGFASIELALNGLPQITPEDVQATLLELTAITLCDAVKQQNMQNPEIYLCGGGAENSALRERISSLLPDSSVDSTEPLGVPPDWVEAAAFAWLAKAALEGQHGNVPKVTGARGGRILGTIYPT